MKKLLATIALMMAFSVQADITDEKVSDCILTAEIAEGIARLQQNGVELSELLQNEKLKDLRSVIIAIYGEHSRYNTKQFQDRVVSDVKARAMLGCMKD